MDTGIDSLVHEFRGTFGRETIEALADDSFSRLAAGATVTGFLPVLAHRFTRERLMALAKAEGLTDSSRPEVLFVCVHNAGRSQMAASLTTHLSGGRVRVRSAGSAPASEINATVAQAMAEIGLDLSGAFPKPLSDEVVRGADVVITMGCGDACPLYPGRRYLDWDVEDPAGQPIEVVRDIRDGLRARVEGLLHELGVVGGVTR